MKKLLTFALVFALALTLGTGPALALTDQEGTKLNGPPYQFNIIGHPKGNKCISGDDSNGRAIMVHQDDGNHQPDDDVLGHVVHVDSSAPHRAV